MMVFGYIIVMFIYLEHVDSAYQKYHTHSIPVHSVKPSLTVVRDFYGVIPLLPSKIKIVT
jgi:hypothetical protein